MIRSSVRSAGLALVLGMAGCGSEVPTGTGARSPGLNVAEAALQGGAGQIALQVSEGILHGAPDNVRALEVKGDALVILGQFDDATSIYQALLAKDPNSIRANIGLGRIKLAKDPAAAAALFEQVLRRDPKDLIALNDLGIARDLQGRHAEAQVAYRQALAVSPDQDSAQVNLALSMAMSGQGKAAVQLLKAKASEPGAAVRVKHDYAVVLALAGNRREAERVLREDLTAEETRQVLDSATGARTKPVREGTPDQADASRVAARDRRTLDDAVPPDVVQIPEVPASAPHAVRNSSAASAVPPPAVVRPRAAAEPNLDVPGSQPPDPPHGPTNGRTQGPAAAAIINEQQAPTSHSARNSTVTLTAPPPPVVAALTQPTTERDAGSAISAPSGASLGPRRAPVAAMPSNHRLALEGSTALHSTVAPTVPPQASITPARPATEEGSDTPISQSVRPPLEPTRAANANQQPAPMGHASGSSTVALADPLPLPMVHTPTGRGSDASMSQPTAPVAAALANQRLLASPLRPTDSGAQLVQGAEPDSAPRQTVITPKVVAMPPVLAMPRVVPLSAPDDSVNTAQEASPSVAAPVAPFAAPSPSAAPAATTTSRSFAPAQQAALAAAGLVPQTRTAAPGPAAAGVAPEGSASPASPAITVEMLAPPRTPQTHDTVAGKSEHVVASARTDGRYQMVSPAVQFASTTSEEAARAFWERLVSKFPDDLGQRQPTVTRYERDGMVFWRVRTEGFSTFSDAQSLCARMRAAGQNCFVPRS